MHRQILSVLVLTLALGTTVFLGLRPAIPQGTVQRPGEARGVIDAANYRTLQAAFDALPAEGGIVRLPPRIYGLLKPLVIARGDVKIVGSGAATHLKNLNEAGEPAIILQAPNRKDPKTGKAMRLWRVQIEDLRISGNPKSGDGLLAKNVNEIYLRGLSVDHNGRHGIFLDHCYENPRVVQCNLTYNKQAGLNLLGCHDIVVNANEFEENLDGLRCLDGFNLCMNGNNIDDHLQHGVVIENTYGSVLSGNMIEECNGTAVVIDRDCYGITVSANVIAHNFSGGVDLIDAWGCAVSANTFTIVAKNGVRIGPAAGRITLTGNNFSNSYIGGKVRREDAATGIDLRGTSDIVITGNNFTGLSNAAIAADAKCNRLVIVGNNVSDMARFGKAALPQFDKAQNVQAGHNIFAD